MEPLLEERKHNQLNTRYAVGAKELRETISDVTIGEIIIRLMKMTNKAQRLSKRDAKKKNFFLRQRG